MATLQPIGWLLSDSQYASSMYSRSYRLSSSECYTSRYDTNYKAAVYQLPSYSSTELSVSATISAPSGEELGGLICAVVEVPIDISATNTITLSRSNELTRNTSQETSTTFAFNIPASTELYDDPSINYRYIGIWIGANNVGSTNQALRFNSVSSGSDSGSGEYEPSTPSQQKITITARPGQPSGNSVPFADNTQFTWNISSIPEDRIYQGTQIQLANATDVTFSRPIFDVTIDGFVTQYLYTTPFSPNSDYIWRAKAKLKNYDKVETNIPSDEYVDVIIDEYYYDSNIGGSSSSATETIIETPWSDPQPFHTKDYEQTSITVNISSPENNASFVYGKQISFRWSISGSSNITVHSSTIMMDGSALATIQGTGTSYTLSDNDAKALGIGSHTWYVAVDCSTNSAGVLLVGSPSSSRNTLYIGAPVATANPSSPSGSSTVKGNAAVQFSWSISKNGEGEYTGSQLEWRYSNETSWKYLGATQHSVTTFTYDPGFVANTVVQWRVRTSLNGAYGANDGWSEPASFTVGDIEIFDARPNLIQPKGTVKGDGETVFAWTVSSQASVGGCKAEYSTDGGITWTSLGNYTVENGTYIIRKPAGSFLLPAGSVEWRVCAAANGPYGDWVQSSFTVSYEAYGRIAANSPLINYSARRSQRIQFDANLEIVGTTSENIAFSEATFCWRMESGTEYAEEPMSVSNTSASVIFSAYKFPSGPLLWYLKANDSKNNDSETEVYVTYILNSSIDSFPIKPIPNVYDITQKLEFEWGFIAQNKNTSSATEIRFSIDGVNWDDPLTVEARIESREPDVYNPELQLTEALYTGIGRYTFPAEYFSAGRVYWQVRSKSSDGVIGDWSEEAQFIARGLPQVRNFACNGKPFATFAWTANEQSSYEIRIDDTLIFGPFHGTEKTFTLPEPLADGDHTASIQVQNSMSLFSNPVYVNFTVANESSAAVPLRLRIEAGVDAELFWAPIVISDENEFLVYCDERLIARLPSDASSYRDRLNLGEHTYTVYQRLESGDYDIYAHNPVSLHSDTTRLTLYAGGPWIDLVLTQDPYPTNTFTYSKGIEKTKVLGAKHPVIEIGDFEEATGSYEVCWPYENYSQIDLFKALVGEAIIIKSRGDRIICGVLESCSFDVNSQYIKCEFQLEQMSTDIDLSIAMRPDANYGFMTNLDRIYFGQMAAAELAIAATNPGYTDPRHYEDIAEAINERLRAAHLL